MRELCRKKKGRKQHTHIYSNWRKFFPFFFSNDDVLFNGRGERGTVHISFLWHWKGNGSKAAHSRWNRWGWAWWRCRWVLWERDWGSNSKGKHEVYVSPVTSKILEGDTKRKKKHYIAGYLHKRRIWDQKTHRGGWRSVNFEKKKHFFFALDGAKTARIHIDWIQRAILF